MTKVIIQLISAAVTSGGFALIYHTGRRLLPYIVVGGSLGWLGYLVGFHYWGGVFLPSLLAGFTVAAYAEIMARVKTAPATAFFLPSAIPLVPGSTLYYCMNAIANSHYTEAAQLGWKTAMCALGIAGGMAIGWGLADFNRKLRMIHIRHEK